MSSETVFESFDAQVFYNDCLVACVYDEEVCESLCREETERVFTNE